jgi:hypothetical protein
VVGPANVNGGWVGSVKEIGRNEAAFRPLRRAEVRDVAEMLAIGEQRPRHEREGREVDEMLPPVPPLNAAVDVPGQRYSASC